MKTAKLNLRLPVEEVAILKEAAKIADVSVGQVCNVLMAFGILRAKTAGILPKKKRRK